MNKKGLNINATKLNIEERKIADKVADEILEQEKKEKRRIIFFLLLFILMVFTLSYFIFSRFALFTKNPENVIQTGSIVFAYEEGKNFIHIEDAMSMPDEIGKKLEGEDTQFDFSVGVKVKTKVEKEITYEISLTPKTITLDPKYVRVMLLENGKEVSLLKNTINSFSELDNSRIRKDSKLLYKRTVSDEFKAEYVFKMWVGEDYRMDNIKRTFSCYVNIDAY